MSEGETSTADNYTERAGSDLEGNLKSKPTWLRLLYMLVFLVIGNLVGLVAFVVICLNFLIVLFSGEPNARLQEAGASIASYLSEIVRFLTYNTETKPFPFEAEWPKG